MSPLKRLEDASLITAVVTPYQRSGEINLQRFDSLLERQIAAEVDAVVIGGTTGAGHLMSPYEQVALISHAVLKHGSSLCIVGATGSNFTREAVDATRRAFEAGMHASLQINPYYGRSSWTGTRSHFERVMQCGPTIVYNAPARTGQDLSPEFILSLSSHENFVGIKECCGPGRIEQLVQHGIRVWSGNDDDAVESHATLGAAGVISVASNVVPRLLRAYLSDPDCEVAASYRELVAWLFCEPNPIPVMTAMAMLGLSEPVFRLPYVPLSLEGRLAGARILDAFDREMLLGESVRPLSDEEFVIVL